MSTEFKCRQTLQMRFTDIDMFGHVNNTVYLQYMDYGKTQYIAQVLGPLFDTRNDALVIVNINVNFLCPAKYDEPLEVQTRVEAIGERSITLTQRIVNPVTSVAKCEARVVMVGFNARTSESIVIPDEWRSRISAYEERTFTRTAQ